MRQPKEVIAIGLCQNHLILEAVVVQGGRVRHSRPIRGRQTGILLQPETRGGNGPGDQGIGA